MFHDAGLVALPSDEWGKRVDPLRRDLSMRILRTPHNAVPEPEPEHVFWGRYRITPNAQIVPFSGAADDALDALDKAGPRGAAMLGAGAGFLFSSSRLVGALTGGLLGYFGGAYLVNLARKFLAAQQASSPVVVPAAPTKGNTP